MALEQCVRLMYLNEPVGVSRRNRLGADVGDVRKDLSLGGDHYVSLYLCALSAGWRSDLRSDCSNPSLDPRLTPAYHGGAGGVMLAGARSVFT